MGVNLLARIFSRRRSKDVAKERLQLVLVHDRASPELIELLKERIIDVISEYADIDESGIDVDLSREGGSVALVASIPIIKIRRPAGSS